MSGVDPKVFEHAVKLIDDGNVFEKFCMVYLSSILGAEFIPVGGLKDKGIDGLEYLYKRKNAEKMIFQFSIERNATAKIRNTCKKLHENKIQYDFLTYVTNEQPQNIDKIIDEMYKTYGKAVRVFGLNWLSAHVNDSVATVSAYKTFIDSYLHEFKQPGKSYVVGDLIADPRIFVFLRQQWDLYRKDTELYDILLDTLIIYSLKDTNPDKDIVLSEAQIVSAISGILKYDISPIIPQIKNRLEYLEKKPRKIKYHRKLDGYVLPFETRGEIQRRNIEDEELHEEFKRGLEEKFKAYLKCSDVVVRDCIALVETLLNKLYYSQGVEFADYILKGESQDAIEKSLPIIVSKVVEESSVIPKNREPVKSALLMTIRDVVYNGTDAQKLFLRKLSNTYMMLFLLNCDPKITTFFGSLASKLVIYVCTSIIIPAMSEIYLDPVNRRHWNLLQSANSAGISLVINETILKELSAHFRKITTIYEDEYRNNEDLFNDELDILYIDEIMIRAYFYARMRDQTSTFYDFIDNFANPSLTNIEEELMIWLQDTFGIRFASDKELGITIDRSEFDVLASKLEAAGKRSAFQAKTDARLILTIFKIREKNKEMFEGSIFGYRTWWLSKDVITQREIRELFEGKYQVGCYIRPDFLYNYIALSPKYSEVDEAYKIIFPTLIGVNLSYHLPKEVVELVHNQIKEHKTKNPARMKMILRDLVNKLISDPTLRNKSFVGTYFDQRRQEIVGTKDINI